jgi:uncharacterized membrane protein
MSLFTVGFLEKIISSSLFLVSGILWKKLLVDKLNYHVIFYRTIVSMFFILMLIITYYYLEIDNYSIAGLYEASVLDWVYTVGLCFFSFWGLYFYTSAIQSGRYSFVVPLSSVTALFSFFTSAFIYNESLTLIRCISLLIIVASLLYHQREKLINFQISKEVVFILLCSIFWGISFVLYLIPIRKFGVLNFSFVLEGCVFLSAVVLLIIKDKKVTPPKFDTRSLFMSVVMGLMVAGGSVLNNLSLTELPVSINIIIGLLFEIIVLMTGLYIFKERLSFNDWILVVFISIGSFILMI